MEIKFIMCISFRATCLILKMIIDCNSVFTVLSHDIHLFWLDIQLFFKTSVSNGGISGAHRMRVRVFQSPFLCVPREVKDISTTQFHDALCKLYTFSYHFQIVELFPSTTINSEGRREALFPTGAGLNGGTGGHRFHVGCAELHIWKQLRGKASDYSSLTGRVSWSQWRSFMQNLRRMVFSVKRLMKP